MDNLAQMDEVRPLPSTLPSTIKTTYLQSSIIKKCPNPSPSSILKPSLSKKGPCYLTKLSRLFLTAKNSSKSIAPDPSLSMSLKYCSRTAGSDLSPRSSRTCVLMKDTSTELVFTVGLTRKVFFLCCPIKWSGIISRPKGGGGGRGGGVRVSEEFWLSLLTKICGQYSRSGTLELKGVLNYR